MIVHAGDMHFKALGDLVRGAQDREIVIDNCIGQRYIGAGSSGKKIEIIGTPGNALGGRTSTVRISPCQATCRTPSTIRGTAVRSLST